MSKKAADSIQDVGEQIKREAAKFESARTEGKALRETQAQRRKKLHALVGLVRAEYENNKTVNGQKTWTEWCKWACPNKETKDPTRWFQKILQEPNRDRGDGCPSSPPTPPYMRVRIRRFGGLSYL